MKNVITGSTTRPISFCKLHTHPDWEIILTTSGESLSVVEGERYEIRAGDILVVPPGVAHGSVECGRCFTDVYLRAERLDFGGFVLTHDYDGSIGELMRLLVKETVDEGFSDGAIAEGLVELICRYIAKFRARSCRYPVAAEFRSVLVDNLSNPDFDMAGAIELTGFSPDYFRRCFESECGTTPARYLLALRLGAAKKLLASSDMSVSEIARQCGFADVYYFSRRFKREVGVTPLEFRKNRI